MSLIIQQRGICDYETTWQEMIGFTHSRGNDTDDQIWLLQHHAVYTQGTSCREQPIAPEYPIPVVHTDRGGQITYHGPGQLIVYLLIDIKRMGTGPKSFVNCIEQIIIKLLQTYGISGQRNPGAPGVYVNGEKIAALGLRISKGCCYHGLSLNVDMDLRPYKWINPCGFVDLPVTQIRDHVRDRDSTLDIHQTSMDLSEILQKKLS